MKAKCLQPGFSYTSAADSAKPGYLKRRFASIAKQMREQKQVSNNVTSLKRAATK